MLGSLIQMFGQPLLEKAGMDPRMAKTVMGAVGTAGNAMSGNIPGAVTSGMETVGAATGSESLEKAGELGGIATSFGAKGAEAATEGVPDALAANNFVEMLPGQTQKAGKTPLKSVLNTVLGEGSASDQFKSGLGYAQAGLSAYGEMKPEDIVNQFAGTGSSTAGYVPSSLALRQMLQQQGQGNPYAAQYGG